MARQMLHNPPQDIRVFMHGTGIPETMCDAHLIQRECHIREDRNRLVELFEEPHQEHCVQAIYHGEAPPIETSSDIEVSIDETRVTRLPHLSTDPLLTGSSSSCSPAYLMYPP